MTVYPPISTGTYSHTAFTPQTAAAARAVMEIDFVRVSIEQMMARTLDVGLGFFGKPAGLDNDGFDAVIRFVDNLYAGGFENILKTAAVVLLFNAVNSGKCAGCGRCACLSGGQQERKQEKQAEKGGQKPFFHVDKPSFADIWRNGVNRQKRFLEYRRQA